MADTKFLNLDEVAAPAKTVKINGKEHPVLDMTVENFIETTRANASVKEATADVQFEQAVQMLQRFIPSIPKTELAQLSFEKLNVLMKFATGELEAEAKKADGDAIAAEGAAVEKQ
jgi:hypothetical protein